MRKKISIAIILVLAVTLLSGCRSKPETLPAPGGPGILPAGGDAMDLPAPVEDGDETPGEQSGEAQYGVSGEILSIEPAESGDILGVIEVKGELENGAMYDYAMVTVTPDTVINAATPATFDDLKTGMYVNVSFDGAVAESYPVQGTAAQIEVMEGTPAGKS